jgi:hypothetical protein
MPDKCGGRRTIAEDGEGAMRFPMAHHNGYGCDLILFAPRDSSVPPFTNRSKQRPSGAAAGEGDEWLMASFR